MTLDITIFNNSFSGKRDYECQILSQILFPFRHKNNSHTLYKIGVLLKSVLIDLRAHNFVHEKTYLRARCVHARNRAHNL